MEQNLSKPYGSISYCDYLENTLRLLREYTRHVHAGKCQEGSRYNRSVF